MKLWVLYKHSFKVHEVMKKAVTVMSLQNHMIDPVSLSLTVHLSCCFNFACYKNSQDALIAKTFAELFGFSHGILLFNRSCCFDDLSRGSVLCLSNASFKTAVSQCHNSIF